MGMQLSLGMKSFQARKCKTLHVTSNSNVSFPKIKIMWINTKSFQLNSDHSVAKTYNFLNKD